MVGQAAKAVVKSNREVLTFIAHGPDCITPPACTTGELRRANEFRLLKGIQELRCRSVTPHNANEYGCLHLFMRRAERASPSDAQLQTPCRHRCTKSWCDGSSIALSASEVDGFVVRVDDTGLPDPAVSRYGPLYEDSLGVLAMNESGRKQ